MRFNLFIVFLFTCKLRASNRLMVIRAGRWDLSAEPERSGGSNWPRNPGGGGEIRVSGIIHCTGFMRYSSTEIPIINIDRLFFDMNHVQK